MNNDEYELLPHQQIQKLREEVERLKYKRSKDEKDHDAFYSSIENLSGSMNKLLRIFEKVEEELENEQIDTALQLEKFNKFEHTSKSKPQSKIDEHVLKELKEKNEELYNENDLLRQRIGELEAEAYRPAKSELPKFEEHEINKTPKLPLMPIYPEPTIEEPINPRPVEQPTIDPQMSIDQQMQYQPGNMNAPENIHDAIEMKIQQQRQQQNYSAQQEIPRFNEQQIPRQVEPQNIPQEKIPQNVPKEINSKEMQRQQEYQKAQEELRRQEEERIAIQEKYNAQRIQQMTNRSNNPSTNKFKNSAPQEETQNNQSQTLQPSEPLNAQNTQPTNYNIPNQAPINQKNEPQLDDMPIPSRPQRMSYDPYEVQRMEQQQKQQAFQNQRRPNDLMQQPPKENFVDPGFPSAQNFQSEIPPNQQSELPPPVNVKPGHKKFMGLF